RGRDRGRGAARAAVHPGGGAGVRRRVTLALAALRAAALGALVLLLWNPSAARVAAGGAPPLVLLDASLSMAGHAGRWRGALDTARALAQGGVIWRFGERVAGFDTLPPTDGTSRLAPALDAAAARGGPVTVVSDGAIADLADIPPDLARRARIVVLPRTPFFDAFVASVEGPRRVSAGDTIRLRVSFGTAGKRETGSGKRNATLAVNLGGRRIASRAVPLPDSGIVSSELTFPVSRFPRPGWVAVEVRLEGVGDEEPRDDARLFVLEVSPQPSVVLLASPPDWETRFLARTLEDVARVPVRTFIEAELAPDSSTSVALVARLARRGPPRPMVTLSEHAGARRAAIAAGGLYRWAFRGGASGEAYRALVAGLVDWLLEQGAGSGKRFVPVTYETPNGMPLQWRWTGKGE